MGIDVSHYVLAGAERHVVRDVGKTVLPSALLLRLRLLYMICVCVVVLHFMLCPLLFTNDNHSSSIFVSSDLHISESMRHALFGSKFYILEKIPLAKTNPPRVYHVALCFYLQKRPAGFVAIIHLVPSHYELVTRSISTATPGLRC